LQSQTRVARDLVKPDRVEYCGKAGEESGKSEYGKCNKARVDPGQTRGLGVRPRCVYKTPSSEASQRPGHRACKNRRYGKRHRRVSQLWQTEPLEIGGQILNPRAFHQPSQRV